MKGLEEGLKESRELGRVRTEKGRGTGGGGGLGNKV